jgi:4'-phosphopantetheinyl transferase
MTGTPVDPAAVQARALVLEPGAGRPPGQGTGLWRVATAMRPDTGRFARSLLDPEESARARGFHSAADADAYAATHAALRLLLGARLGTAPERVRFARERCSVCGGPHGRPCLPGGEVQFSISRRRGIGLIALGPRRVGVDVEHRPDPEAAVELAGSLHPCETAELQAMDRAERAAAFTRIWVRKEAYRKGLGVGLALPLSVDYLGAGAPAAQPVGWTIRDVRTGGGHFAAVAVADGPDPPVSDRDGDAVATAPPRSGRRGRAVHWRPPAPGSARSPWRCSSAGTRASRRTVQCPGPRTR